MTTKNISITEEAYRLLVRRKLNEWESFSKIITREFGNKDKFKQLFGILNGRAGEEFEKELYNKRKKHSEVHKRRNKKIEDELN